MAATIATALHVHHQRAAASGGNTDVGVLVGGQDAEEHRCAGRWCGSAPRRVDKQQSVTSVMGMNGVDGVWYST